MPTRSLDKDPLNQGLVLSLPFMEGTGALATADVSKAHHPMTLVHAPVWTQLANGLWVLDFDGTNDYIRTPNASAADLNFTSGMFSGCAWIYPSSADGRAVMGNEGGNAGWMFYHAGSRTKLYNGNNNTCVSLANVVLTTWHLVGFSRTATSVGLHYLNGLDNTDVTLYGTPASVTTTYFIVGAYMDGSGQFRGKLWNPRVWSRTLSPAEHRQIFLRERHLFGV